MVNVENDRNGTHSRGPVLSRRACVGSLIAFSLLLAGCSQAGDGFFRTPSALSPSGPDAARVAVLWWIMAGLGTLIYLGVIAYLLWALYRRERPAFEEEIAYPNRGLNVVIVAGIVIPAVVLLVLFGLNITTMAAINGGSDAEPGQVVIDVIGHQWWWEVRYVQPADFTTANEIHVPVGERVLVKLGSADVIHSFWVPELTGKLDMVPGQTNVFTLEAGEPGAYLGECAEFCGTQHAKMQLWVIAETPADFETWLERESQPAAQVDSGDELVFEGQQVFLGSSCVYCHAIRGTNASGTVGPDLTHLASRRSLGAGILENNQGNLAGWIIDPQTLKPGNRMPPMDLSGEELQALLAYLETLE